jgi:hypothetical protein
VHVLAYCLALFAGKVEVAPCRQHATATTSAAPRCKHHGLRPHRGRWLKPPSEGVENALRALTKSPRSGLVFGVQTVVSNHRRAVAPCVDVICPIALANPSKRGRPTALNDDRCNTMVVAAVTSAHVPKTCVEHRPGRYGTVRRYDYDGPGARSPARVCTHRLGVGWHKHLNRQPGRGDIHRLRPGSFWHPAIPAPAQLTPSHFALQSRRL